MHLSVSFENSVSMIHLGVPKHLLVTYDASVFVSKNLIFCLHFLMLKNRVDAYFVDRTNSKKIAHYVLVYQLRQLLTFEVAPFDP